MSATAEVVAEDKQAADDLKCTISGASIFDTVMGFGLEVSEQKGSKQIVTDLYPMSYESFYKDGVRMTAGYSC